MTKEYKILSEFNVKGKDMLVVRIRNNAHVMEQKDLQRAFGCWHPEYWKGWNKNKGA